MAAHAFDQRTLLLGRARHAGEPFGVGELAARFRALASARSALAGLRRRHRRLQRPRAHSRWRGCAGCNARAPAWPPGKRSARPVADDGDGERRAGAPGADQHAFHRAFLGGADATGQRHIRRSSAPRRRQWRHAQADQYENQDAAHAHHPAVGETVVRLRRLLPECCAGPACKPSWQWHRPTKQVTTTCSDRPLFGHYLPIRQSTSTVLTTSPVGWRRMVRCSL